MCVFVICCFVLVGFPEGESGAATGKEARGRSASGCSHYTGLPAWLQGKVNTYKHIHTLTDPSPSVSLHSLWLVISDRWQIKGKTVMLLGVILPAWFGSTCPWVHLSGNGLWKSTQKIYWFIIPFMMKPFYLDSACIHRAQGLTEGFDEYENDAEWSCAFFPLSPVCSQLWSS